MVRRTLSSSALPHPTSRNTPSGGKMIAAITLKMSVHVMAIVILELLCGYQAQLWKHHVPGISRDTPFYIHSCQSHSVALCMVALCLVASWRVSSPHSFRPVDSNLIIRPNAGRATLPKPLPKIENDRRCHAFGKSPHGCGEWSSTSPCSGLWMTNLLVRNTKTLGLLKQFNTHPTERAPYPRQNRQRQHSQRIVVVDWNVTLDGQDAAQKKWRWNADTPR